MSRVIFYGRGGCFLRYGVFEYRVGGFYDVGCTF